MADPKEGITFRSTTWGTCALDGQHAKGTPYWQECPLNPVQAAKRSERTRKGMETRRRLEGLKSAPRPSGGHPDA